MIYFLSSIFFIYFITFFFYCSLFSFYIFFFSSRRRHTRCLSDWSSDVCSSDLSHAPSKPHPSPHFPRKVLPLGLGLLLVLLVSLLRCFMPRARRLLNHWRWRSEERRVGKECRSGWWRDH